MRPPPPLNQLPRYPVVGGLALLSIAVSLAWWTKAVDITPLGLSPMMRQGQLWRLLTPILPHVNPVHLLFNVYWLWVFGTLVEEEFGHARTTGIILLLAVGSCAADYAFTHGGVGLSGVNYGFFGLLWVLSRHHPDFEEAVDQNTIVLMVAWQVISFYSNYFGMIKDAVNF